MRFMIIVKANGGSDAGAMPSQAQVHKVPAAARLKT